LASIRIVKTPPGFAPEEIRSQWVGVEIPLATSEELAKNPLSGSIRIGNQNTDGYVVLTENAVAALEVAGKGAAVDYWEKILVFGRYLQFKKDVCELIP
jgi:hypothetical protein